MDGGGGLVVRVGIGDGEFDEVGSVEVGLGLGFEPFLIKDNRIISNNKMARMPPRIGKKSLGILSMAKGFVDGSSMELL